MKIKGALEQINSFPAEAGPTGVAAGPTERMRGF